MRSILQIVILFFVTISYVLANDPEDGLGIIKGRVTTADGKPAATVSVRLKGTKKGTLTEDDGSFVIHRVPAGNYELEISQIGYETITQQVQVDGDKTIAVSIQLKISDK